METDWLEACRVVTGMLDMTVLLVGFSKVWRSTSFFSPPLRCNSLGVGQVGSSANRLAAGVIGCWLQATRHKMKTIMAMFFFDMTLFLLKCFVHFGLEGEQVLHLLPIFQLGHVEGLPGIEQFE